MMEGKSRCIVAGAYKRTDVSEPTEGLTRMVFYVFTSKLSIFNGSVPSPTFERANEVSILPGGH